MKANEAYQLICDKYDEKFVVTTCRDYGEFFGFFVKPEGTNPNKRVYVGMEMICVNKTTKEIYTEEIFELSGKRYRPIPVGNVR